MKTKSVLKLLVLAVVLIVSVSFSGCNLVDSGVQFDDSELSRKVASENKPTGFDASVTLYITVPDFASLVPLGQSNHHRVTDEQLSSDSEYPIVSKCDLFGGNTVVMTNITNYNLDGDLLPFIYGLDLNGTGDINGSNHSTIKIMDGTTTVMILEAHGTIVGNYLDGAYLDMNWTSVKGSGTFKGNARGKITGDFYWVYGPEGPVASPYGIFNLTGTYK
jgi:hypothetical protein